MATTYTPKKILDLKRWEMLGTCPTGPQTGFPTPVIQCDTLRQINLVMQNQNSIWLYDVAEDGWFRQGGSGTIWGAASCGAGHPWSTGTTIGAASLTATGGTTSTITTNQTLVHDLRGWKVHIMEGPNAGLTLDIVKSTTGANSVITVATQASAFTNATKYRLLTPRWYMFHASGSSVEFRLVDWATDGRVALSTTGLPTSFGTGGAMIATPSWIGINYEQMATGTATSATATTLVNSSKTWTSGQWVNYQIRIVSGTGAGQIRTITANDATSVTVATWTTTPDNTSTYSIEGNDDFLYLIGHSAVTMYRYQISTNTWTTVSPAVARGASVGAGTTLHWVSQSLETDWRNESAIINGRRLYSFRAGGLTGTPLDYYDIPSNSWTNVTYNGNNFELYGTSTKACLIRDKIYLTTTTSVSPDTGGNTRWMEFDCARSELTGWSTAPAFGTAASILSNTAWKSTYREGDTELNWVNFIYTGMGGGTSIPAPVFRCLVI